MVLIVSVRVELTFLQFYDIFIITLYSQTPPDKRRGNTSHKQTVGHIHAQTKH